VSWNKIKVTIFLCFLSTTTILAIDDNTTQYSEDYLIIKMLLDAQADKDIEAYKDTIKLYKKTNVPMYLYLATNALKRVKDEHNKTLENLYLDSFNKWQKSDIRYQNQNITLKIYKESIKYFKEHKKYLKDYLINKVYKTAYNSNNEKLIRDSYYILSSNGIEQKYVVSLLEKSYFNKSNTDTYDNFLYSLTQYMKHKCTSKYAIDKSIEVINKKLQLDSNITRHDIYPYIYMIWNSNKYKKEKNYKKFLQKLSALYFLYDKNNTNSKKKFYNMVRKDFSSFYIKKTLNSDNYELLKDFLEKLNNKTIKEKKLLYSIYKEFKEYDKAIEYSKILYRDTKKPMWLAEGSILEYEKAEKNNTLDKNKIQKFIKNMKKAIDDGEKESSYLNYLGYILIDKDIDIQKGINLVKKALKLSPNNPYYLDSLAWGEYKTGKCKEAYRDMERVIAMLGIKYPEIKLHWKKIKECYENTQNSNKK